MLRSQPKLKGALLMLLAIALILVGAWVWIGLRTGIWTYPEYDRYVWLTEKIPVASEFWGGNIKAGDSVEELIQKWPPAMIDRFGPWVRLNWVPGDPRTGLYFIGLCATAKNGVLVNACVYSDDGLNSRTFFNTETTNDQVEYDTAFKTYVDDKIAKNEKNLSLTNEVPMMKSSSK